MNINDEGEGLKDIEFVKDIGLKLINKARKKNIFLKYCTSFITQNKLNEIQTKALLFKINELDNIIDSEEFPKYIEEKNLIQLMIDGQYFLKKGDLDFDIIKKGFEGNKRFSSWEGIIYKITCKLPNQLYPNLANKLYLGRTYKTKSERFIEHIKDALESFRNNNYDIKKVIRYVEKVILYAIELILSTSTDKNDIQYIKELIYNYDELDVRKKDEYYYKIVDFLLEKYIDLEIIEVHRVYDTCPKRELWNIRNYKYRICDKIKFGTLWPNGLNMIKSGGGIYYISLPLYDIIFTIMNGCNGKEITTILNTKYNLNLIRSQLKSKIHEIFGGFKKARIRFWNPIIRKLLNNYQNIKGFELAPIFGYTSDSWGQSFTNSKIFKHICEGLSFSELKQLLKRTDFDWKNFKHIVKGFHNKDNILGYSKNEWIEWFIKDKINLQICHFLGLNPKTNISASSCLNPILRKKFGLNKINLVKKYRKIMTIKWKSRGKTLEWIYVFCFGNNSKDHYLEKYGKSQGIYFFRRAVKNFFKNLFDYENEYEQLTEEIL